MAWRIRFGQQEQIGNRLACLFDQVLPRRVNQLSIWGSSISCAACANQAVAWQVEFDRGAELCRLKENGVKVYVCKGITNTTTGTFGCGV